jgi:AraC-like DNA-binding protein
MDDGRGGQTTSEYGVLGVRGVDYRLDRFPASADVAGLVERHWTVSWDLPPGRSASVTLLPHPCVNLVHDRDMVAVAGVGRSRFTYEFTGRGRVFGVKFRPGGFYPFLGRSVAELTDQTVPLWWPDAGRLAEELTAADLPALATVAERHLLARWPAQDPMVTEVGVIVHALLHDRTITRVEEVSARFGIRPRTLQRMFRRYVGVSPKWVLSRYRLHEAAARLAEGVDETWAEVAVELGYFDQPHFIRDFTRAIGQTPAAYAESCRAKTAAFSA